MSCCIPVVFRCPVKPGLLTSPPPLPATQTVCNLMGYNYGRCAGILAEALLLVSHNPASVTSKPVVP